MKYLVRTPATVANLGPGFDCLGLALDLWNEMLVETCGDQLDLSIEGEGNGTLPRDESNAIYQAMVAYAQLHGRTLPSGIQLSCHNRIPLSSGLGSSSAATVSGILASGAMLDLPDNKEMQLDCATQLEGHPDNVAPCLWGGLTISMIEQGRVITRASPVHSFSMVIVTPDYRFPTLMARAALPEQIPHQDAVFNLGRVALLTDALRNGDIDLLSLATEDRLHQPYRIPLIPGAEAAMLAAREAGAVAVVLAGAGPSLMAFIRDQAHAKEVGHSMMAAFQEADLSARLFIPLISPNGASVQLI
jgi:homoserine kinase